MATIRMKPFCAVGLVEHKSEVLNSLQHIGCVELVDSKISLEDGKSDFDELNYLSSCATKTNLAIKNLNSFCKCRKNFFGLKRVESTKKLDEIAKNQDYLLKQVKIVNEFFELVKRNETRIFDLECEKSELIKFLKFDYFLNNFETKFTKCLVAFSSRRLNSEFLNSVFDQNFVYAEIISSSKLETVVFFVVIKQHYESFKQKFEQLKFSEMKFSFPNLTARQRFCFCEKKIDELKQENLNLYSQIKEKMDFISEFEVLFDFLTLKLQKQKKIKNLLTTKHTFVISGFLNPLKLNDFCKITEKFGLFSEVDEPVENSPVNFKNCGFVSAVENITKTYAMPSKQDVDPNPVMAFFYYLFFGIMFSDAGYGLLMAAFCSIFAFSKRYGLESRKKFQMFFFCGVSTVFWGIMFGSFFGDFIGIFSKKFFGLDFKLMPILVDPLGEPMKLLGLSLALGFLQIFVGILIKFYALIKFKRFKEAFFVELGWILLLLGALLFAVSLVLKYILLRHVGCLVSIFGAGFIVFLSGYSAKGLMKPIVGFINLYGATSYVGDVLSYCRLMALAIATGVVASVVNLLSTMLCVSWVGFFGFVLVFLFGHAMNFGINALGAYVHTVRLQYVEFFNKFYSGGGKLFSPFGMQDTKFVEFVDVESY